MNTLLLLSGIVVMIGCLLAPLPLVLRLVEGIRGGSLAQVTATIGLWIVLQVLVVVGVGASGSLSFWKVAGAEILLAVISYQVGRSTVQAAVAHHRAALVALWRAGRIERLALTAIIGSGAGMAVTMLLAPSGDYDSWMYQLPQVAEWMQSHVLGQSQEQWLAKTTYERGIVYYPGNWSALFWLCTAPMRCDLFTLLPNLPAWILIGMSTALMARLAGSQPRYALLAAALVMTIPMAGSNLQAAHVDLGQGALLAGIIALLANALMQGCSRSLLIALAMTGMLLGTKMSAIGQLAAPLGLAAWLWPRRVRARQHHPVLLGIATASLLLLGCWWYARNWLITGNPLGFVAVPRLGWPGVIDQAYIAQTSLLHTFHLHDPRHWRLVIAAGLAFGGLLALAAPVVLGTMLLRRRASPLAIGLAALVILLGWEYISGPWSGKHAHDADLSFWLAQQLRYTWTIWALLAVLTGLVIQGWERFPRVILVVTWLILLATTALPFTTSAWWITLPAGLIAVAVTWWIPHRGRWSMGRLGHGGLITVLIIVGAALLGAEGLRWHLFDRRGSGIPSYLDAHLAPGEGVAFWGSHQSWLLYGRDLSRPVHYLDLDGLRDARAGDAAASRIASDLISSSIHYLAIGPRWRDFPDTPYGIIENHPDHFRRVVGHPQSWVMCLYQVLPALPARPSAAP